MEVMAPLNQTMNIQLDVCAVVRPICWDTAMCRGTAPNAYHTNAVKPAHNAGGLKSRILCDSTTFNSEYTDQRYCLPKITAMGFILSINNLSINSWSQV